MAYRQILVAVVFSLVGATCLHAGAWTLEKGRLRVKTAFLYQKTSEQYYSLNTPCPLGVRCTEAGQRVDFPFDGESRFSSMYSEFDYGLFERVQLHLALPFYDIRFTDLANPNRPATSGIGDIRFGGKYLLLTKPAAIALAVFAKAPTGFVNRDVEVVPIGDAQWDLEFATQIGKSLWPIHGYLNLDLGYRFRFAPDLDRSTVEPGDEIFFRGEAGYNFFEDLLAKVVVSGFWGTEFKNHSRNGGALDIRDSERRVLFLEPALYWNAIGGLAVEGSVKFSLAGKNVVAGLVYSLGLSYTSELW